VQANHKLSSWPRLPVGIPYGGYGPRHVTKSNFGKERKFKRKEVIDTFAMSHVMSRVRTNLARIYMKGRRKLLSHTQESNIVYSQFKHDKLLY